LKQLGLILNGTVSPTKDFFTYSVWSGNTKVGSGYFDNDRRATVIFSDSTIVIPSGGETRL